MLMASSGSELDLRIAAVRADIDNKRRKADAQEAVLTSTRAQIQQLGSIIPGFVSTGETLNAMRTARRAVDDLQAQINNASCKVIPDATSFGGFRWGECNPSTAGFRLSFENFVSEFYDWYHENIGFWSRFADTNALYDQAQRYVQRTLEWRAAAIKAGIVITGVAVKPKSRDIFGEESSLSGLVTFAKWMTGLAVAAIVAPPLIRAVGDFIDKRRDR